MIGAAEEQLQLRYTPFGQILEAQCCHVLGRALFVDQEIEQSLPECNVPVALERPSRPSFQNA